MPQNTTKPATDKPGRPAKPYPDFPLFPHATGRWAKKIRGKFVYFGKWDDPDAAIELYNQQRDDLHGGRTPRIANGSLTIRDLLNHFLTAKERTADAGEITARTFADYHASCARLGKQVGLDRLVEDLAYDDFDKLRAAVAKKWGPVALGNEIQRVRSVFKFGYDAGLIDKPVRYGPNFKRPSRKVLRMARNEKGPRMLEADQIRTLLGAAKLKMKAMILLGINCGFGNSDIGKLPIESLDYNSGWVTFPRPKTGIPRRCPLWPETVKALKAVAAKRPEPKRESKKDGARLLFITKQGRSWSRTKADSPISKIFGLLLEDHGMKRPGLNFYALRHTFETIAGESRDQVAVDHIMGHAPASHDMASVYRERISDERLKAVTDCVRKWLFVSGKKKAAGKKATAKARSAKGRKPAMERRKPAKAERGKL